MVFAPSNGTGAVILSNQRRCPVTRIGAQIMSRLNGTDEQMPEPPPSDVEN
jgi:hypothetical protein